jgi:hypothetical protein
MMWPFPARAARCENAADERGFLARPGEEKIMILDPAINIERNAS